MDAKKWLESVSIRNSGEAQRKDILEASWVSSRFAPVFLYGLCVSSVSHGRALCSLRIPPHLTDEEGNWQVGPIATVMDMVAAATILTSEGTIKVSDEVEIKSYTVENKGRLTTAVVEIRNKENGQLLAVGRQWMTSSSARPFESKL